MSNLSISRARALQIQPAVPLITDRTQGRVELSRATFDNWVSKTVNFLRMEAEIGQAATLRLDLPLHWMTAVWLVAAWEAGADVTFDGPADLSVGTEPGVDIQVVADPLGMAPPPAGSQARWTFPADVRSMPDQLVFPPPPPGAMLGITAEGLFATAEGYAARTGLTAGGRLATSLPVKDLNGVLATIAAAIAVDASVIFGDADDERATARAE